MQSGSTDGRLRERVRDERESEREVGRRRVRREDYRLITGQGEYTDDIVDEETVHVSFHRSRYGHADIEGIDTSTAEDADGVLAVFTAADLAESGVENGFHVDGSLPEQKATTQPLLAEQKVRYAGEPVAVIVAEDRYRAANAADLVEVDYDRLDAATDVESALAEDTEALHPEYDDNRAFDWHFGDREETDEAFDQADHTVSLSLSNQRVAPNSMEPRGARAAFDDETGRLTVHMSTQVPHRARGRFADALPLGEEDIRVIAPDVGGGFGSKGGSPYSEEPLTAWAATQVGRPTKWIATRTESLQTDHHGRDVHADVELAVDEDGKMRGLRVDARFDLGAYLVWGSTPAGNYRTLISGQYTIPTIDGHAVGAYTNKTPVAPYRGAGRPESIFTLERIVKRAADELGMDPAELRRRNLVPADDFPHETAHGVVYDSGNYERAMEKALEVANYEERREQQRESRETDDGRLLGIGMCSFVENTGSSPGRPEMGRVKIRTDGTVLAHCGTADHGQGHGTTYSQALSDELGVPYEDIEIVEGDTDDLPEGVGTFGSRSAPVGVSALVEAAEGVVEQATELAATHLDVPPADLEFEDGVFTDPQNDETSMTIQEVAALAHEGPSDAPDLEATASFDPPTLCYSFGTHIAVVTVEPTTGEIEFEQYVAVDDVGTQFNPRIVEGQVMGGVAQGIGQALYEGAEYDSNGTLATGSFQDYAMPKAQHIPDMDVDETETPAPNNPTGAKGAGEGGTIGAPPAVVNAVVDALRPYGVEDVQMPMTAERVWQTIEDAK